MSITQGCSAPSTSATLCFVRFALTSGMPCRSMLTRCTLHLPMSIPITASSFHVCFRAILLFAAMRGFFHCAAARDRARTTIPVSLFLPGSKGRAVLRCRSAWGRPRRRLPELIN